MVSAAPRAHGRKAVSRIRSKPTISRSDCQNRCSFSAKRTWILPRTAGSSHPGTTAEQRGPESQKFSSNQLAARAGIAQASTVASATPHRMSRTMSRLLTHACECGGDGAARTESGQDLSVTNGYSAAERGALATGKKNLPRVGGEEVGVNDGSAKALPRLALQEG